MKVKKALVTNIVDYYKTDHRTGERYKPVKLKIVECDPMPAPDKRIGRAFINKNTPALLIMALETGGYIHNFNVRSHPTKENEFIVTNELPEDFFSSYDPNMPLMDNYEKAYGLISNQLGEEYSDALGKVMRVRQERRDQYGDKFLTDTYDELITQVNDKMKRVKLNVSHQGENQYETALDAALDAVNYSIFIAAKIINSKQDDNEEQ